MREPFFSVIIPALNEERFIAQTLAALRELSYPPDRFEVILVDSGSMDRTPELARSLGARVLERTKPGVGAARNLGAREARGEILAFLDADCLPAQDWLQQAQRSVARERCITGAEVGVPDNAGWIERAWYLQSSFTREEVTHINTGNMIVPRDLFFEIGEFDESLVSGEDYEFCARARTERNIPSIADNSVKVVHLGNPKTLTRVFYREVWHGLGALGTLNVHWFDKSLVATLLFLVASTVQVAGLVAIPFRGPLLFAAGTAGVLVAIAAAIWNRRSVLTGPLRTVQLGVIYYVYFLGRSVSLFLLLFRKREYLRER